jgi:hypothetical protein
MQVCSRAAAGTSWDRQGTRLQAAARRLPPCRQVGAGRDAGGVGPQAAARHTDPCMTFQAPT